MVRLAAHVSGFPREKVIGLSGVLDGARLASFISEELGVSVEDVSTCILGEHGRSMVIVPRLTTVNGQSMNELLSPDRVSQLVERTVGGGAEIVGLLKTGSAFYAPSAAITRMVEAVLLDRNQILSCAVGLDGEYGIRDAVISVPVKLGHSGVMEVIELNLTEEEKAALEDSAASVREVIKVMKLEQV
jgi:malate dehydrogenase